jgi:hypothetical protein
LSHHLLFSGLEIERKINVLFVSFSNFGKPILELYNKSDPLNLSHHLLFSGVEIEGKIKVLFVSFSNFGNPYPGFIF